MTEARWDFALCVEELRRFSHERAWEAFHDPKNLAMLLSSEVGELLAELRWVDNAAADTYVKESDVGDRIGAELADVMIAVLLLADRIGIDLRAAVFQKVEENRINYPKADSIGVAHRSRPD